MSAGYVVPLENLPPHIQAQVRKKLPSIDKRKKPSKYRNVRTFVDGIGFHSKREAEAWTYLKRRENAGEIRDLRRQVAFQLFGSTENGKQVSPICIYIADFTYTETKTGRYVVADAKGCVTALFRLKAKMLKASHGIDVEIV